MTITAKWWALFALLLVTATVLADTVIVVNPGRHRSAEEAGHSEAKVNWLDADYADDTACTESFAALELQHHLQKLAGRFDDFDIVRDDQPLPSGVDVILIGGPASNAASRRYAQSLGIEPQKIFALGFEGYRIKNVALKERRVTMVAGGSRVGTLYGAYDLLHRLGYRWFAPGEVNEEVPHVEKIPNLDVTERPSFSLRRLHGFESRYQPGEDLLLWMARNRMNSWCVIEGKTGFMRKLGIQMSSGEHTAEWLFLNPTNSYPYDHEQFSGDEKKPRNPYPVSAKFRGDANQDGKLSTFEAHPEWFALVNKKRIPGINYTRGYNYCTSNPDATAEFLKNYVQAVVNGVYQNGDVIVFWTLDGGTADAGQWCECAECKALGSITDRYLQLVYQFDKEIKKARAAGRINRPIAVRFMIYRDVIKPPTRPLPADFDYATCTGTFFPALRCYEHDFADTSCSINRTFQQQLDGWVQNPSRHYRGPVGIGEYYNIHRHKCLPLCLMHSMARDIPWFYKTAGARQFDYMHVTTENWGNKSLTNWQMARQLWDVDTDCDALWKDYFNGRYGPASRTMRRFYESLEKVNFREIMSVLSGQLKTGEKDFFPTTHLRYERKSGVEIEGSTFMENLAAIKNCRALINQALASKTPDRIKSRLAEDERLFAYGENMPAYFHALVQTFEAQRAGHRDEALRHFAEARRVAELLRQDTTSPKFSWDHEKATNALDASNCAGTLEILSKLLEPSKSNTRN